MHAWGRFEGENFERKQFQSQLKHINYKIKLALNNSAFFLLFFCNQNKNVMCVNTRRALLTMSWKIL